MKKSKLMMTIMMVAGVLLLLIGYYLAFRTNTNAVDKTNTQIAQNATSAESAARQISINNQRETRGNSLGMFLLGFGGVITLFSITTFFPTSKNVKAL